MQKNKLEIKEGDILEKNVDCIVNPWNMNYIPFFLLYTHGLSGQIKKKAGYGVFYKLMMNGVLSPGSAVITDGGKLKTKIIHVAGLKWYWVSSLEVVEKCTKSALELANKSNIKSIAFPLIVTGVMVAVLPLNIHWFDNIRIFSWSDVGLKVLTLVIIGIVSALVFNIVWIFISNFNKR